MDLDQEIVALNGLFKLKIYHLLGYIANYIVIEGKY